MSVVVAPINGTPDIFSGIIVSPIIRPPVVSRVSMNVIPVFIFMGPVAGRFVQISRGMAV
jgi:hypothetical protein